MSDKDRIEVGDVVVFSFPNGDAIFDAEVLYIPQATGDAWHVRDRRHGDILYYVQQYETMKLVSKHDQTPQPDASEYGEET